MVAGAGVVAVRTAWLLGVFRKHCQWDLLKDWMWGEREQGIWDVLRHWFKGCAKILV